jgi:hypothetical protein
MGGIFLSYRRDDSADICGRIYDHLVARYGKAAVFKDVDSIPFGESFPEYIQRKLSECSACLVVIGAHWLDSATADGQRRLDDPGDFVRLEIETALKLGLVVIPVLVSGAKVPPTNALPETLARLHTLNAAQVRVDPDFATDIKRLSEAIDRSVPSKGARPLVALSQSLAGVRQSLTQILLFGGSIGLISMIAIWLAVGPTTGWVGWIAVLVNFIGLLVGGYMIGRRNGSRLAWLALGTVAGLLSSVGVLLYDAQTIQLARQACTAGSDASTANAYICLSYYPGPLDWNSLIVIALIFPPIVWLAYAGGRIGQNAAARRARREAARAADQQTAASEAAHR